MRMSMLYGRWVDDENGRRGVQVDAMYESLRPPPDAGAGFMSPGLR